MCFYLKGMQNGPMMNQHAVAMQQLGPRVGQTVHGVHPGMGPRMQPPSMQLGPGIQGVYPYQNQQPAKPGVVAPQQRAPLMGLQGSRFGAPAGPVPPAGGEGGMAKAQPPAPSPAQPQSGAPSSTQPGPQAATQNQPAPAPTSTGKCITI